MDTMSHHLFSGAEIIVFRRKLLKFYDQHKRTLPWRDLAVSRQSLDERAYAVWVSEVMLQQTQVATVIDYYNRWMKKWPTVDDLAKASLEDVKTLWSGLGYYSRGQRLHQAAQKVVDELNGCVPRSSKELQKQLSGVGRYTADLGMADKGLNAGEVNNTSVDILGAIASIAYNEVTSVVDGNVIRVLTRMRLIGADSSTTPTNDFIWDLANKILDEQRPGDFNQAIMELGATICTPKSPHCSICPVQMICKAFTRCQLENKQRKIHTGKCEKKGKESSTSSDECLVIDIEDVVNCAMCLPSDEPWNPSLGVMNYPRKQKKKKPEENTYLAVLLSKDDQFYMTRRPEKGLLAGMWEFPLIEMHQTMNDKDQLKYCRREISINFGIEKFKRLRFLGKVSHMFSHLHHTYNVYEALLANDSSNLHEDENRCWMTKEEMEGAAISTAIRKIMKLNNGEKTTSERKRKTSGDGQRSIDSMFKKVCK